MSRAITHQRVAAADPPPAAGGRNDKAMTADEMLAAADKFEREMKRTFEHAETLRVNARRTRDIIRMTCVEDRYGQIRQIWIIAKPRFETIKSLRDDEFPMRAQFTIIREGADRLRQLADEIENCTGDSLDSPAAGLVDEAGQNPGSIVDPTLPADPVLDVPRAPDASPYR
jgi:hypothetical protein